MSAKRKPPICVDFDGVIHGFQSGWADHHIIIDDPVDGTEDALNILAADYTILIFSCRCKDPLGREAIAAFMQKHHLPYDYICTDKPTAIAYIDDYGYHFTNWHETIKFLDELTKPLEDKEVSRDGKVGE